MCLISFALFIQKRWKDEQTLKTTAWREFFKTIKKEDRRCPFANLRYYNLGSMLKLLPESNWCENPNAKGLSPSHPSCLLYIRRSRCILFFTIKTICYQFNIFCFEMAVSLKAREISQCNIELVTKNCSTLKLDTTQ